MNEFSAPTQHRDSVEPMPTGMAEPLFVNRIADPAGEFDAATGHTVTPTRRALKRFMHSPAAVAALGVLVLMILVAIFGKFITPHNPNLQKYDPFLGPNHTNWLGTDDLGRDVASRLIAGTAVSMRVSFQTVGIALLVAVPIGLLAGYRGGATDQVLMRTMDGIMSFPALLLALVIAAVLGPGLNNAILAITIVLVPTFVRLTRASTLAVTQETFVEASRSIGTKTHAVLFRRVLPSVISPIIVLTSIMLGTALIVEASLSFLGLGIAPPNASWGNMLRRGFSFMLNHPFQMVPPGLAIALAVLSFNLVGDALRDALGLARTPPAKGQKWGRIGLTSVADSLVVERREAGAVEDVARPAIVTLSAEQPTARTAGTLLSVRDLRIEFATESGLVTVVDGMSFDVKQGEVVGLLGESGSGKTVTSMAIMRLLTSPPALISSGEILFDGRDLLQMPFEEMAQIRGKSMSMVFQDPMSSLNPAYTIGNQLIEAVRLHQPCTKEQARTRSIEMLEHVGIADPAVRMKDYPHRLSGGMRQRVLIAMALVNQPRFLIADEPTTALDVTVQAQIIRLLKTLREEFNMGMIFVSHDLGVVAEIADRAIVMYAGELVEEAPIQELFRAPRHPYTKKLLTAVPQATPIGTRLPFIPGVVPTPGHWPVGCRFASRCDEVSPECLSGRVDIVPVGERHTARCVKVNRIEERLPS
jgi:peptide/nickel transport system permease protein